MAEDIIDQAKEILGVEDQPKDRKKKLEEKKAKNDDTDRDRKELHDLQVKGHDKPL